MEWYKIVGFVSLWFIGVFLYGKLSEYYKTRHFNDSWRNRNKKE